MSKITKLFEAVFENDRHSDKEAYSHRASSSWVQKYKDALDIHMPLCNIDHCNLYVYEISISVIECLCFTNIVSDFYNSYLDHIININVSFTVRNINIYIYKYTLSEEHIKYLLCLPAWLTMQHD